jgi:hypothetical protein
MEGASNSRYEENIEEKFVARRRLTILRAVCLFDSTRYLLRSHVSQ